MDKSDLVSFDIECYVNYTLVMFKRFKGGQVIYFEKFNDSEINIPSIKNILKKYTMVSFNGLKYDHCIILAVLAGFDNKTIHKISVDIINNNLQPWQVRKQYGIVDFNYDHIDIKEVAPLNASLKIYAGRINAPKMQDLPIHHTATIHENDLPELRSYCENDNDDNILLFNTLEGELDLRNSMSLQYKSDVRSKSDAQVAEAVFKHEFQTKYDINPKRPKIATGTEFYFKPPDNIGFQTTLLDDLFYDFTNYPFKLASNGHVELPDILTKRVITIGSTNYKIGVGGLHSMEKSTAHVATNGEFKLKDYDVRSFYPYIILNNKLAPKHLGKPFLKVYKSIVDRRLTAKEQGNKVVNESLKITINGSFGKFASKWSFLYSPDLMMQVTVTGQLSLLMLIEMLEESGISVVSANTDGIVVKMKPEQEQQVENIVWDWENLTDYIMEANEYSGLYSRDVNNYIAIYANGNVKSKGAYGNPGLKTNPANEICKVAVRKFLKDKTPVEETIKQCKDITQFVTVRTVNGGALYENELIGKAIRWYYSKDELDAMYYQTSGNKVPRSDGARPLMELPKQFPKDIDYKWYIDESYKILKQIGVKTFT